MVKLGLVFLDNDCFRPFSRHREIRRGRNKGRIEVQIRKLYRSGEFIERPRIVDKDQIRRYPDAAQ